MVNSLKTRLICSIALIALVSILIISVIVNFFFERQFRTYAVRRQEDKNQELVSLINRQYVPGQGWNIPVIENIGVSVLEESLILKVVNNNRETVWDALEYNSGICHTMMEQMAQRMVMKYPAINGGLTHETYNLAAGGQPVGSLTIGYYGPFFYTDSEFYFIETLNKVLFWVTILTLILSILFGVLLSVSISNPITAVNRLARNIARGDYHRIEGFNSSINEVKELIETINEVADTLNLQNTLRKRLTSDVAHELRTPLTTLRGELEAMIDGVWDPSPQRLKSCHEEIVRITNLIRDMETLSRYDADTLVLKREKIDMKQLIEKNMEYHKNILEEHQTAIYGEEAQIEGDRDKLGQVILNLLTNALKHTPRGGSITISLKKKDKKLKILLEDTGEGIPPEDLPHIFERFYRVDKSRTRSTGGSGIGLTIVKEIMKAHKGSISIESTPGEGTKVNLTFPLL